MNNDEKKNDIISRLKPYLREYLESQGIEINNQFFRCIHPDHEDRHPSCSIGGDYNEQVFHCFSCLSGGNLFHAVHYLEGKPKSGIGFWQDTVPYLAEKFNEEYDPIEITDDQKREYQKRAAYEDAVNVIHKNIFKKGELRTDHPGIKHLLDRGIKEKTIKRFKIGCVDSFSEYMNDMKLAGWKDRSYLESADLANKKIFSPNNVIVPIFDEYHRPVGFVSRKSSMGPNEHGSEKYVNSHNSDIYHKSKILFNFQEYDGTKGPLIIVEGYLSAVYMSQLEIPNVCALGSRILTEEHVDLLFNKKVKRLILCLDGDDPGIEGTKIALERLSIYKSFNIRVPELPKDDDPDSFIRSYSKITFMKLLEHNAALSPFAWMLKHTSYEDDPMEVASKAVPTIAAEESNINRLKMIRELAQLTSISIEDIKRDVDSLVNKESSKFIEELGDINDYVKVQLGRRKVRDTGFILEDAYTKVKALERQYNAPIDGRTEFMSRLEDIRSRAKSGNYKYGMKPKKFKRLYELTDGVPYTCNLTLVGGRPSSGKSCFLTSLATDIIDSEPDTAVYYMTIDDNLELTTFRVLAIKSGITTSEIKRYSKLNEEKKIAVDQAWDWVEHNSDRLIIVDSSLGNSVDTLEANVEWFKKNVNAEKKLVILDNLHKLRTSSRPGAKKSDMVMSLSERIKDITQAFNINLIATVELRKLERTKAKPTLDDMKDTVQLEYDADVGILIHNYQQVDQDTPFVWDGEYDGITESMPYLEVNVAKNKVNGQKGRIAYQLNSKNLNLIEKSYSYIKEIEKRQNSSRETVKSTW